MTEDYVSEREFADALVTYVQNNPAAELKNAAEQEIPDHWVVAAEGEMNDMSCLVYHGLFDSTFEREAIIPRGWSNFEKQYRSPEADLVDRIYQECQTQGVADWTPESVRRNAFPVTRDAWSQNTQERNYQRILGELDERGLLTKPRRTYADEPNAIGVRVRDKIVDFPGSYKHFECLKDSMYTEGRFEDDFPQDITKYDGVVPVGFMLGDTLEVGDDRNKPGKSGQPSPGHHIKNADFKKAYDEIKFRTSLLKYGLKRKLTTSPKQKLFELVAKHTNPTPKHQSIMYVFAEKTGEEITPRKLGHMSAFMLEFAYGAPAGHVLDTTPFMIPQDDLVDEERHALRSTHSNWKMGQKHYLKDHPAIWATEEK